MTADVSRIWVDADACPVVIRDILLRAAKRTQTPMCFVANHALNIPQNTLISFRQVQKGFDEADHYIAQEVQAGDLVVTQDIPLASEVIDKQALALNPRGQLFTKENIKARLNMRDFMETLRSSGIQSGGPATLGNQDKQAFANQLDKWLAKRAAGR